MRHRKRIRGDSFNEAESTDAKKSHMRLQADSDPHFCSPCLRPSTSFHCPKADSNPHFCSPCLRHPHPSIAQRRTPIRTSVHLASGHPHPSIAQRQTPIRTSVPLASGIHILPLPKGGLRSAQYPYSTLSKRCGSAPGISRSIATGVPFSRMIRTVAFSENSCANRSFSIS